MAEWADLNERQRAVLRFLAARPGSGMRAGGGWTPDEGAYAFHVEHHLQAKGLAARGRRSDGSARHGQRSYQPSGAANTLAALRRRGLVEFAATPGCFVQARWRISEAGRELVRLNREL